MSIAKLGERLRKYRRGKGYSLPELAEMAGISKGYLWQMESGKKPNPSIDVLNRLAKVLDRTIAELIHGEPLIVPLQPQKGDLPDSLKEFIKQQEILGVTVTKDDIAVLASIHYRGKRPATAQDWSTLYGLIKSVSKNVSRKK